MNTTTVLTHKEFEDFKEANYSDLLNHIKKDTALSTPIENRKLTIRHLLPFGKYKGKIVETIIKKDKQYIQWLYQNEILKFDKEVIKYLK